MPYSHWLRSMANESALPRYRLWIWRNAPAITAVRVWTIKRNEDELFREYRRECKKRFVRIRTGRTTKEQFYAWSEQAREKKEACETGKLPRVEFIEWLKGEEV